MPNQPHVVWICQWYPHEGEPYAGDFIQRHAKAAAAFLPITTFSCFAHTVNKVESYTSDNLTEHIIYFKATKTGSKILDKVIHWGKWFWLLKKHLRQHFDKHGNPDLIHCHIILNAGWLGLWAKKKFGIPFLVTEHWSGYMPGAINGFTAYNRWSQKLFSKILDNATAITGVSKALIQTLQQIHPQGSYIHLPNVVDDTVFTIRSHDNSADIFKVIHVSTFSPHKNMEDTFTAFDALAAENPLVEFHIVGPREKIASKWPHKKFSPAYRFHGEMPQANLAALMQGCQVCVLYSHYETFGCIVIEAHGVGLPVVASDIPVLQEIVQHGRNGLLVSPSNPVALQKALSALVNKEHYFDTSQISETALQRFSYQRIGRQIFDLYKAVIAGNF